MAVQASEKARGQDLETVDCLIAGGGYVGMALAAALVDSCPGMKVAVVDLRPRDVVDRDKRASAVAAAVIRMFKALGAWDEILPHAQPINDMIVTDSRTDDPVRPVFLSFDGAVREGEPFAHMVPNGVMTAALRAVAERGGARVIQPDSVTDYVNKGSHVVATLGSGRMIEAKLLIAADGVRSRLRDLAGISVVRWSYGQSAIVTTVAHERPHNGRAEEHFLPSGPFAILPLTGNRSSIVWSERSEAAERLVKFDDVSFLSELTRRFGHHLGEVSLAGPRGTFPLGLTLARRFIDKRFALAGDAAHGIHPIAGQGMNLGLRDAAALAEAIVEAARLGLDIGSETVLERYQQARRFDTVQMGVVCDVLTRLFSNDVGPVRALRSFGLGVVDRLPRLKRLFIDEAAGMVGTPPRLLQGERL